MDKNHWIHVWFNRIILTPINQYKMTHSVSNIITKIIKYTILRMVKTKPFSSHL